MKTSVEIMTEIQRTSDPKRYDALQKELQEATKQESLEHARQMQGISERQKSERMEAEKAHLARLAEIDRLYQEIAIQDDQLFEGAKMMTLAAKKRLELSEKAVNLEALAGGSAEGLGQMYTRRRASLYGGAPLYRKPAILIKCWLQRCADWQTAVGTIERDQVISHGLQGGGVHSDAPLKF